MVTPLPDKTSADSIVLLDQAEIILQISRSVAHRVTEFTHHKWFSSILIYILMDLFQGWIHPAEQIDVVKVIFSLIRNVKRTLKMRQTGIVKLLRPLQRRFKGTAIGTFISHGPDHNTRTVLIPLHTALCTVYRRLSIIRIVRDHLIPEFSDGLPVHRFYITHGRSVAFIVRLVDHIKSHRIVQFIEMRRIGIMTGTDRVDIMLLHQNQILHNLLLADGKSGHRIAVVTVHTVEFYLLSVEINHISLDMDLADTHMVRNHLMLRLVDDRIQIRLLCVPQMGVFHFHVHLSIHCLLLRHKIAAGIQQPAVHRHFAVHKFEFHIDGSVFVIL